eukprot:gnl/MRDRNA2_/MRDRNA2_32988_c0_seq1.p1 gnl/MRDRNA2_/MRDRNA2_32988_c0~~gnl/MRDRNA2_/MRDRNA2_32988_c0_seq1.p1  ORF type:complete len:141 (-),score=18.29 gnl/MRDRNA2_/MRDRNA2_32988_c0_seq1:39-461(-)
MGEAVSTVKCKPCSPCNDQTKISRVSVGISKYSAYEVGRSDWDPFLVGICRSCGDAVSKADLGIPRPGPAAPVPGPDGIVSSASDKDRTLNDVASTLYPGGDQCSESPGFAPHVEAGDASYVADTESDDLDFSEKSPLDR